MTCDGQNTNWLGFNLLIPNRCITPNGALIRGQLWTNLPFLWNGSAKLRNGAIHARRQPLARSIAKDHDQKRQHILKASARVFAEEGIARASMVQVARACGISKANIYHYYDSKDALLFDILDTYLSALRDRLLATVSDDTEPEDHLNAFVSEVLLAYLRMDAEHKIQSEGIPLLPEDQQVILKSYQRDIVRALNGTLAEIAPQSFEHDKSSLRATTMSIFGMLNWYAMWNKDADQTARSNYARLVCDMVVHGVRGL